MTHDKSLAILFAPPMSVIDRALLKCVVCDMSEFDDHDNPKFRRKAGADAEDGAEMRLTLDGKQIFARAGDTVAAAMLANGASWTKDAIDGGARAPFCMMGLCFECLVEIDGRPSQRACITPAREGMIVIRHRKSAER